MSRAEHHTTTRRRVLTGLVPSVLGLGLAVVLTGCGAGQITQTATQQAAVDGTNATVGPIAIRNAYLAFPNNPQGVYQPGSTAQLVVTIVNTGESDDTLVKATSPAAANVTIDGSQSGSKQIPAGFSIASYPSGVASVDSVQATTAGSVAATSSASSSSSSQQPGSQQPSGQPGTTTTAGSGASSVPPPGVPNGSGNVRSARPTPTSVGPVLPGQVKIELVDISSINGAPLRAGLTIPITLYFAHAGQVTLPRVPIGAAPTNDNTQGS